MLKIALIALVMTWCLLQAGTYSQEALRVINCTFGFLIAFVRDVLSFWRNVFATFLLVKQVKEILCDIHSFCKTQDNGGVNWEACSSSVLDSIIGTGLTFSAYKMGDTWREFED